MRSLCSAPPSPFGLHSTSISSQVAHRQVLSSGGGTACGKNFCPAPVPRPTCLLQPLHPTSYATAARSRSATASLGTFVMSFPLHRKIALKTLPVSPCTDCKCLGPCTCACPTTARRLNRPQKVVVCYRRYISDESEIHFLNKITKFKPFNI